MPGSNILSLHMLCYNLPRMNKYSSSKVCDCVLNLKIETSCKITKFSGISVVLLHVDQYPEVFYCIPHFHRCYSLCFICVPLSGCWFPSSFGDLFGDLFIFVFLQSVHLLECSVAHRQWLWGRYRTNCWGARLLLVFWCGCFPSLPRVSNYLWHGTALQPQ